MMLRSAIHGHPSTLGDTAPSGNAPATQAPAQGTSPWGMTWADWASFALVSVVLVGAYFVSRKDVAREERIYRNQRRMGARMAYVNDTILNQRYWREQDDDA